VDSVIGDAKMTGAHDKFIALNQAGVSSFHHVSFLSASTN
jgi:hypothetical protein